jgi:sugar/nucleoside kinase (ribokinase family)
MQIAVVGNLTLDMLGHVELLPGVNEVSVVRETRQYFGGWAGNIATILQHLGLQTSLFAVAGNDFVDSGYEAHLSHLGVDIDNVAIITNQKCAHFFEYKDYQHNSFAFFQPNVEQEYYDSVLQRMFDFSKYYLVCLAKFGSDEVTNHFLQRILENRKLILAVALGHILYLGDKELLTRILSSARYIFMNQTEAQNFLSMMGFNYLQDAFSLPGIRLDAIITTQGEQGSTIYSLSQREPIHIRTVPPKRLISTLGAGDTYMGAFLSGVAKGWKLQKCGEFASTFSSFVVENEGVQTFLPAWEELEQRFFEVFHYHF